jgi:hypothetical protein
MTSGVSTWWAFLCAVAALNVIAWSLSAAALGRRQAALPAEVYAARRLQLLLSAGYVFGCAFRSVVPVFDVPRVCLFDSWLCTVIVGRTIATIAELCFVTQLALMLHEISRNARSVTGRIVSMAVVPLIVVAECCSWYSVLTTSNLGHVFEESIWGLSAALMVASAIAIWPRSDAALRRLLAVACVGGVAYVAYMFSVDVPMYWARWTADQASGRAYLSVTQGLLDVSDHWVVSRRWDIWRNEIAWMSLYFSVAVWFSIGLIHMPFIKMRGSLGYTRRGRSANQ